MDSHGIARSTRPKTQEERQKELDKIQRYRELEEQVRQQISRKDYGRATFDTTSKLLKLNPEYYTIWNVRRRCIISGFSSGPSPGSLPSTVSSTTIAPDTRTRSSVESSLASSTATPSSLDSPTIGKDGTTHDGGSNEQQQQQQQQQHEENIITSELMFTIPLLMAYPKCYWLWNYRLWILQRAVDKLPTSLARGIWEEELGLVGKMLHRDRRNFHAWGYRRHVVAKLESPVLAGQSLVEQEFAYTTKMINMDLSNFSAWHNRSQLIPRLLNERSASAEDRQKLLEEELALVGEGLNVGPEDQSLWYYHQYLMLNVLEGGARSFTPDLPQQKRSKLMAQEIANIDDLLEDYADTKWIYESLIEYTLANAQLQGRRLMVSEQAQIKGWLSTLGRLDPKRRGRWTDLETELASL